MLNPKETQLITLISKYKDEHKGKSPSLKELANKLDISINGTAKRLNTLEKKGFIRRHGQRYIEIIEDRDTDLIETLTLAILGETSAGDASTFAEEKKLGEIQIDKRLIPTKNISPSKLFALKIVGTSMNQCKVQDELLDDGNIAIIEKDAEVKDNDVVLSIIDNLATIKIFRKTKNQIILSPKSSDPIHMPILLDRNSDFLIQGKVIASLKM